MSKLLKLDVRRVTVTSFLGGIAFLMFLLFSSTPSVHAAVKGEGPYEFTREYDQIYLGTLENTPSINFTTKPSTNSSENYTIYLQRLEKNNWVKVAKSNNSGRVEDTCALNPPTAQPKNSKYRIVIQTEVETTTTKKGQYSYIDWNNN